MHSTDSNLTSRGYGRRQYGQGRYGVPVSTGGFGKATDKATLKRLRLQQQRQRENEAREAAKKHQKEMAKRSRMQPPTLKQEEVAALMILQIMRGKGYG